MPLYEIDGHRPELPGAGRFFVADTAVLIGRVRLKPDASIWFGSVLRGDNDWIEIGEGSNIQDNSVLHTDADIKLTVGAHCTVGHRVILHGCSIGDNSLIGMGAIIMNGAVIGKSCVVGAGALITEGKQFPDFSLIVGSPAKLVRTLDEKTVAGLTQGAAHYVANGQRYVKSARRIS